MVFLLSLYNSYCYVFFKGWHGFCIYRHVMIFFVRPREVKKDFSGTMRLCDLFYLTVKGRG